jgi:hypothetical protein
MIPGSVNKRNLLYLLPSYRFTCQTLLKSDHPPLRTSATAGCLIIQFCCCACPHRPFTLRYVRSLRTVTSVRQLMRTSTTTLASEVVADSHICQVVEDIHNDPGK